MINQFSKKINIILYLIVILSLSLCTFLIIKAPDLLFIIQNILENKVFHRTFSLEKWADTINSLIAFPVFFVVFFEAVLFPKYSDTFKLIHILTFTVLTLLITCIASAVNSDEYMTSDMASELLLAKECYLQKSLFPRTWFYSTELRVLNTQIISAPLFIFTTRIYTFSSYNTTTFTRIGDVTFSDLHSFFLRFLGYKNEVSVFTPSGIINILLYVFYVSFFIILIKELKWLTPARYYTENFGENQKVFFIVLNVEYNQTPEANIFLNGDLNGDLIYTDNKYRIYQYNSNTDFINSFTSTKD